MGRRKLYCEKKTNKQTKKTSRGDGIPAELFKILKDDAFKVLHSGGCGPKMAEE